jgi:divalent metal cation (Fe/Co/Zn/Cd) transporter
MHMEVPAAQTLAQAHATADQVEQALLGEIRGLHAVEIHIEPRHDETYLVEPIADPALRARVVHAAESVAGPGAVLTIHVGLPGDLPITEAHARTAEIERAVRDAMGTSYRVTVHPEPV